MKFDSKSFNPLAFGTYINHIPNMQKNELAKSGAVGANKQARSALSSQSGSLYARIPYFGRINGTTSQNNDGNTNIASSNTSTFEQGFITASRMDSWTEKSFSRNITAGVDFMDSVAAQIADYKFEVKQTMLLKILQGIFSMSTSGDSVAADAARDFINNHIYDISDLSDEDAYIGVTTLNNAVQKACGDSKNNFRLAIMHSTVATRLENLNLLKYLTYTDKHGVERELSLATWNGRSILIDDNMPTEERPLSYKKTADTSIIDNKLYYTRSGSSPDYIYTPVASPASSDLSSYYEPDKFFTAYTTYILGEGSIILDNIGDTYPYEMSRDPGKNGGEDTLYVRDRYVCGVDGISFEKPASITASASNDDLACGDNWVIINDGVNAIPHKSIAIAKIISKG